MTAHSNTPKTDLLLKSKRLHYNKPQLLSMLVLPFEEYAVWGRGTGKSEGLIAPRAVHLVLTMPRSTGAFVGATYQQLLTRTLPPVILGWEKLGYKKDVHFFIGKKPPKAWKWPEAYRPPLSHDYFIWWYNGSGIHLISQDRPGTSNGLSIDWIIGDETKLLNKKKLDSELLPTNRGNGQFFGHLAQHHSMLYCTDMPTQPSGKWILEKEKEMNVEQIELIKTTHLHIIQLKDAFPKASKTKKGVLLKSIQHYENLLNELRFESVYYSEFSSLENIEALGVQYIKQMRRSLQDLEYQTSILGRRVFRIENGWYGLLDEDIHEYNSYDYSFIDNHYTDLSRSTTLDCRQDADIDKGLPLDISLDYGGAHNFIVTGQPNGDKYRFLNAMYVKSMNKEYLKDLLQRWCEYYKGHTVKEVIYYYDHTATGTYQGAEESCEDIVCNYLTNAGFDVNKIYIGHTPTPKSRYILWQMSLSGNQEQIPMCVFNKTNCKNLLISMYNCGVLPGGATGYEKDKRTEKKDNVPQEEAPHFSDAADTLLWGRYSEAFRKTGDFVDNMVT